MDLKRFFIAAAIVLISAAASAEEKYQPDQTLLFAVKGADSLYLDIYNPTDKIDPAKPTILFMFGGGFKEGTRDSGHQWFKLLCAEGYPVVSIDYRLGLKDYKNAKLDLKFIKALDKSIALAVEDLFSATAFLLENGEKYGVDARNMVLSGSSAGAISVLQGEYEVCNRSEIAKVLPADFNYTGVMAFSGAIYSHHNPIKFYSQPCPIALFHGTADKIVNYKKIAIFNQCFGGANEISKQLKKQGVAHHIYRFEGHGHEVAIYQGFCFDKEMDFLEQDIMKGNHRSVDALIDDPEAPGAPWGNGDFKDLY